MSAVKYTVIVGEEIVNVEVDTEVRANERRTEALNRACRRLYRRRAFWWEDAGVPGFGQAMHPEPRGTGNYALTGRVRADVVQTGVRFTREKCHCTSLGLRSAFCREADSEGYLWTRVGYQEFVPREDWTPAEVLVAATENELAKRA